MDMTTDDYLQAAENSLASPEKGQILATIAMAYALRDLKMTIQTAAELIAGAIHDAAPQKERRRALS